MFELISGYAEIWIPVLVALSGLVSAVIVAIRKTKKKNKEVKDKSLEEIFVEEPDKTETETIVSKIEPDGTKGDIDINHT